jgi:hypothetical protein
MMKIAILFLSLFMAVTMGCSATEQRMDSIYGLKITDDKLMLQVMSNGCTSADSFQLSWQNDNLSISRIKADHCRRRSHKIWLSFTIPTQIKHFKVLNSFSR